MSESIFSLVGRYANAIGKGGTGCPEAQRIRQENADNAEFLGYADGLDRVKRHLGGKGMLEARYAAAGFETCDQNAAAFQANYERNLARKVARLTVENTALVAALRGLLAEVVASGNGEAKDFGWPKAVADARVALAMAEGKEGRPCS